MPCCKAEEYKWCKDEPVVNYKDDEGRGFCVFHAPQGKKRIPLEEFNTLVFTAIDSARETKEVCNLSGTVFEGDISFNQYGEENPLPRISFFGCKF